MGTCLHVHRLKTSMCMISTRQTVPFTCSLLVMFKKSVVSIGLKTIWVSHLVEWMVASTSTTSTPMKEMQVRETKKKTLERKKHDLHRL